MTSRLSSASSNISGGGRLDGSEGSEGSSSGVQRIWSPSGSWIVSCERAAFLIDFFPFDLSGSSGGGEGDAIAGSSGGGEEEEEEAELSVETRRFS